MGLQSIYQISYMFTSFFTKNKTAKVEIATAMIVAGALFLVLFILQGVGIYTMAKRLGRKKKALAFVPFVNLYYIGKLVGECIVCGQRMKRAGLYAMIAEILASTVFIASIVTEFYLYVNVGEPVMDSFGYPDWSSLNITGLALALAKINEICNYVIMILILVESIMMLLLMTGLFKKYSPRNYFMLGAIIMFIPISRYIIIFTLRNRQPIDYEAYMRARREAYFRQQQQYYNGYGGGYPNNPYQQNPYQQSPQPRPKPEDPFSEFGGNGDGDQSKNGKSDEPFEEFSDGFFN
ncbi:MAG: hypothetical protein IKA88_02215 [Clostridia bacterium]|nr:hypothetical protein [Clostridia bacterium]